MAPRGCSFYLSIIFLMTADNRRPRGRLAAPPGILQRLERPVNELFVTGGRHNLHPPGTQR